MSAFNQEGQRVGVQYNVGNADLRQKLKEYAIYLRERGLTASDENGLNAVILGFIDWLEGKC